ncbi:unnamed protein product [Urochloa decumbens]|uniref:Receptor-like serine/threonine-protein kinase n=1 Tax=Urochloa decumbens TaxID=240449 RepID=A0ABC9E201_9POAL
MADKKTALHDSLSIVRLLKMEDGCIASWVLSYNSVLHPGHLNTISNAAIAMDAVSTVVFLLALIHLILQVSALNVLSSGSHLSAERGSDVLHSPDGTFTCGFYNISPNSSTFSIWFSKVSERTVVWSANPLRPVYTWGSKVKLNFDGSMVLRDYGGQIVWTNNVSSSNAEQAQLLDTGNLIVKGKGDTILWQSFNSPTDTLLPTQRINSTIKLESTNRLLVPGHYSLHFDDQVLISLFDNQKDLSFIYWPDPTATIWQKLRIPFMINASGLCKVHGVCGRNGICVHTPVPSCVCPPGFEIIDPNDWGQGCRPKINNTCDEKNMKFVHLPNTNFYGLDLSVHRSVSLNLCKNICLSDCSCNGFAYFQGSGECYPKAILLNGRSLYGMGSMYLKLAKGLEVSASSIPQSQFFGPKYGPNCNVANEYVIANFTHKNKTSQNISKYLYFYGFLSAIFVAELVFIVLGWFILRRERNQLRGACPAEAGYEMITNHFRRYTYRELVTATRKFKDELGRGASGIVYKGVLKDNRAVAVKKLGDINQGGEEFQHELSVIGRIYHMNLVRVWGFCSDGPHRILISEYVENGSLDKTLFSVEGSEILLEWKQRFHIALGVARGLAYLHHECLEWVIHCDVKPENILLDENLEPKIADFGLAKLLNRVGSNINVSRIQGTRGYLAPEWVSSLPITAKVDVYSFGVVLLDLLKGARISDMEMNEDEEVEMVLGRIVRILKENLELDGTEQSWISEFIDTRLNGDFNYMQARTMMKLAVSCLEEDRSRRPTMENVVQMLVSVDEVSSSTVMGGVAY